MPTAAEYSQMSVRITSEAVFIGDHEIPGCIEAGGVTVTPGGHDDINRMTITFLVGPVTADDPFVTSTTIETPATTATQYDSRRPASTGEDTP